MEDIVKNIKKTYWNSINKKKNVVGFSGTLQNRLKNGKVVKGKKVFRVYVSKKDNNISCKDLIPSKLEIKNCECAIDNIEVDVVEIGTVKYMDEVPENKTIPSDHQKRIRPYQAGTSCDHVRSTACTGNIPYKKQVGVGITNDPIHKIYISGNAHCFALENDAKEGDLIVQPSLYDGCNVGTDTIAKFSFGIETKFKEFTCPYRNFAFKVYKFLFKASTTKSLENINTVDIAFAEPVNCNDISYNIFGEDGRIIGKGEHRIGQTIYKSGRTSAITSGKILDDSWNGYVQGRRGIAQYEDCVLTDAHCEGGDSVSGESMLFYKENGIQKYNTMKNAVNSFNKGNTIEVLSIEDKVRLAKPQWHKVKNAINHGIKDVYEVTFSNGKSIKLTKDHSLFKIVGGKNLKPATINEQDKKFITVEEIPRDIIDNEMISNTDMEFIGLWIADGSFGPDKNSLNIATGNSYQNKDFVISYAISKDKHYQLKNKGDIRIHGKSLVNMLIDNNINGNSNTKRIPEWIFMLPEEKIKALIRGYFRGNGSFHTAGKNRTVIEFGSVNKNLLKDIQTLLNCIGIQSDLNSGNKNKLSINLQYKLQIWKIESQKKFLELIEGLEKKKDNLVNILLTKNGSGKQRALSIRKIRKITKVGQEEVFDFTVNPSESFVANGILCHNSGSPVYTKDSNGNLYYLGALFAGSDTVMIYCKYENIEKESGCKVAIL